MVGDEKADLAEGLSNDLGVPKIEAEQALDSMLEQIIDALKQGDRVNIFGFGTFAVSQRDADRPQS